MRRSKLVALAAVGASASLALGAVMARTSDSVTSQGNSAQTGTFTYPGEPHLSHDIKAVILTSSTTDCSTVNYNTYTDGPFTQARTSTIDFPATGTAYGSDNPPHVLCLKNAGPASGAVYMSFINITDTEVGACTAGEASPAEGNDTSCADGAAGELGAILIIGAQSCSGGDTGRAAGDFVTPRKVVTTLASGATCRLDIADLITSTATDAQKAAAQTDKYQYDAVFTLQDS